MSDENPVNKADNAAVIPRMIEEDMKESYLNYAMSSIVGRALPDVRDGFKPVHRRILYAMHDMGILHNKGFKKSARIVGEVLGKYHPHGDSAVYDSMVRMVQTFALRYPLIDGQGNFGSIDGDGAAAMRYCITGDSLLLSNKGIIPISSLSDKKESNIDIKICNYKNITKKANKFFNSGKHKTIKVITNNGFEIEGSCNHPVLVWDNSNQIPHEKWKLLEELDKKDIIILNRGNKLFSENNLELLKYVEKIKRAKDIDLPREMNPELALILGAITSEGSYHNKQILFCNSDLEYYNKVKEAIYNQFKGISIYERKMKDCSCYELSIYSQNVVRFLQNIGLSLTKSDKKEIPFSVLQSKKECISMFLRSLFEGNGSIVLKKDARHNGQSVELTYNSKSEKLVKQLKIVLLNFGIITTKPYLDKRNNCYKLIIPDVNAINIFKEEIGFLCNKKRTIIDNIKKINTQRLSKNDYIPYVSEYLRKKYNNTFVKKNNFDRYNKLSSNIKKLSEIVDKKDLVMLKNLLNQKYLFNTILSIERKSLKEVYSIRVDSDCHSFVANGFINHNTETRMQKIGEEMLKDIEKETVKFKDNFDGSLQEPEVLPSTIPNLLVNGSTGIAVGMATNMAPHNITEISNAVIQTIKNPEIDVDQLMHLVSGPDFPTGGTILGRTGIKNAYHFGRGKIKVRAKIFLEENKGKQNLIVSEIPYQVNKSVLLEQIADLVRDKKITGISDLRDESDKRGMRIVIILKTDANAEVIKNQLFKYTNLQTTFGIINLAIVDKQPKVLSLKALINYYVKHRKEVILKRTEFDLRKAEERSHILEGLLVALSDIDRAITIIKTAESAKDAKDKLITNYQLSEIQASAILDMKLQKLTGLEQDKIKTEHKTLQELIVELKSILASESKVLDIIIAQLEEIKSKYGDERRTEISDFDDSDSDIDIEDLIDKEEMIVTITNSGYIKRISLDTYKSQKRGGKGIVATGTKAEDEVKDVFVGNTHDQILFFTDNGTVQWKKVYKIPESSRQAKGTAIVNLLEMPSETKISAYIPIKEFDDKHYLVMVTKQGIVKKTNLDAYSKPRKGGIIGINLSEGDELIDVLLTDGNKQILIATKNGMAVKFNENDVRAVGRNSIGVRGIKLKDNDEVVGAVIAPEHLSLLTITENGYGKRTSIKDYRLINRGGSGVRNIIINERNGNVVTIKAVDDDNDLLFISKNGIAIRTPASGISVIGRNTQGMRLMKLKEDDCVVGATKIVSSKEEETVIAEGEVDKKNKIEIYENEVESENFEQIRKMDFIDNDDSEDEEIKEENENLNYEEYSKEEETEDNKENIKDE